MKKNLLLLIAIIVIASCSVFRSTTDMEGFVRLCDLKVPPKADSKDNKLILNEVYCITDSLLIASGHRSNFNYFFVYELTTFQLIYDTALNKVQKYSGNLCYTTVDDSSDIYLVKETYQNTYWKISIDSATIIPVHCSTTPNNCKKCEPIQDQRLTRSSDGNFAYKITQDRGKYKVVVWLTQEEFQKKRDEIKKLRKDIPGPDSTLVLTKNYFLSGGRGKKQLVLSSCFYFYSTNPIFGKKL